MLTKVSLFLSYFQMAWAVLKEVKELIDLVEEADPDDGQTNGKAKKDAVLDLIGVIYDSGNSVIDLPVERKVVLDLADNAIDIFVNFFNIIGRFRSKSEPIST